MNIEDSWKKLHEIREIILPENQKHREQKH